jgi:hypothetical protein
MEQSRERMLQNSFIEWWSAVDLCLRDKSGYGFIDFPDEDYWKMFEAGTLAEAAATKILEKNGFFGPEVFL